MDKVGTQPITLRMSVVVDGHTHIVEFDKWEQHILLSAVAAANYFVHEEIVDAFGVFADLKQRTDSDEAHKKYHNVLDKFHKIFTHL